MFVNKYNNKKTDKIKENFKSDILDSNSDYEYLEDALKFKKKNSKNYDSVNPNFVEVQFHNDYRDTITAFNNLAPSQKQIFNQENAPTKFSNPDVSEVKPMIKDFITELNKNITNSVTEFRNSNSGWDEAVPDQPIESGWEKQMKKLGLPPSLYNKPAEKSEVKLIKIDHLEKHETEGEIKYTCFLILQKKNVKDQMILRVNFVMTKNDPNIDRNFFSDVKELDNYNDKNKDDGQSVIIEDLFVLGYLTRGEINEAGKDRNNFYNFAGLEDNEHISQPTIMKELMKKYRDRTRENNNFNATLDEEGRNFHRDLPHLRNYKSYQTTRTIFDDWKEDPNYS
jgi:hypothetical protein